MVSAGSNGNFLSGCTDETESMSSSEHTVVHLIPDVDVSTRGLTAPQQVNGYHYVIFWKLMHRKQKVLWVQS